VMYLGKLVEIADADALFARPTHPYTEALLAAVPVPGRRTPSQALLQGTVPNPMAPPSGCRFRTRCRFATELCAAVEPPLRTIAPGHEVACHLRAGPTA
jgi:oligopeptide/dipeptide ABC transporter ATP-binding protein